MAAAVAVGKFTLQHERHRLESAVGMRAKRQTMVVRRIDLRTVVIEKQEHTDPIQSRARDRTAGSQIADVIAHRGMGFSDSSVGHDQPVVCGVSFSSQPLDAWTRA